MYYTVDQLKDIGFKYVGKNTKISLKTSFYEVENGCIGDNTRVDDFCIIKGHVELHNFVHIGAYSVISGIHAKVVLSDFVGVSTRLSLFTASDNHGVDFLGNSCTPVEYTAQIKGPVTVGLATLIGAHCIIMPNIKIGIGASIGANCMVFKDVPDGGVLRSRGLPELSTRRRDYNRIMELAGRVYENINGEV